VQFAFAELFCKRIGVLAGSGMNNGWNITVECSPALKYENEWHQAQGTLSE
jgi:hypothetical protein